MKTKITLFWKIALSVAICILFIFALSGLDLAHKAVFKPADANVERKVFENTKSFTQGMTQQLVRYRKEYMETTDINVKEGILSTVRLMFADYDQKNLDPELQIFLAKARGF